MRTITKFSMMILLTFWAVFLQETFAQAPARMSYQAVIRNSSNALVSNHAVGIRISIIQGSIFGASVYVETHNTTSNANGLVSLEIGGGTVVTGNFESINWANGPYFIKTETDPAGGTSYSITGTTQLLSVPYALHAKNVTNDADNQLLALDGSNLSISGGNQVVLPEGFKLPYSGSSNSPGATSFQVINSSSTNGVAIFGRHGDGSTIGMLNSGAVFGSSRQGYGVVGYSSAAGPISGVLGRSDNASGSGIYGYGSNGAKGGFFETAGSGAALATGLGNVGIGVGDPDVKLEVNGTMRVNSNTGRLELGYPGGDKWFFSTSDGGESLVLNSQLTGEASFQRVFFNKDGRMAIASSVPEGRLKILHNSTFNDPQLILMENGNDYSRISFKKINSDYFWGIAGYIDNADSTQDRLNFYNDRFGDVLSLNGRGIVGIRTISPISDLHLIHREIKEFSTESGRMGLRLQNAGSNGNFWNLYVQNANGNLELYFKNTFKGSFNDTNGAYTATSDERLKKDIRPVGSVLDAVLQLKPKRYRFKEQDPGEPETLGFLAQDVIRLFPELVQQNGDGGQDIYTMDYAGFGIIAIKAIQEQQQMIEQQQRTIDQLLERIEKLVQIVEDQRK